MLNYFVDCLLKCLRANIYCQRHKLNSAVLFLLMWLSTGVELPGGGLKPSHPLPTEIGSYNSDRTRWNPHVQLLFLRFFLHWTFFLPSLQFILLFIYSYPHFPCIYLSGISMRPIICIRNCVASEWTLFSAGSRLARFFLSPPFTRSVPDLILHCIWPTCFLSDPVCLTLALPASVFVVFAYRKQRCSYSISCGGV